MTVDLPERPLVSVIGGMRGIGLACVRRFLDEGYSVVVGDVDLEGDADADLISRIERRFLDVSSSASVTEFFAGIAALSNKLDALVNVAGIVRPEPLAHTIDEVWNSVLNVNLGGTLRCSRAAFPLLSRSARPSIVNFSSLAARLNGGGRAPYAGAKAGIEGLTRALAQEWASLNIRVNSIAPGWIGTRLVQQNIELREDGDASILARIPLRRLGEPAEIAHVAEFLASPRSSYVTGQTIFVDGGAGIGPN